MPKYWVEIDASNFLVSLDGWLDKYGFVTSRAVESENATAAEFAAVQMLREDQELRDLVQNEPGDPPVMDVIGITEVESFDGLPAHMGRVWYPVNPRRWWQF